MSISVLIPVYLCYLLLIPQVAVSFFSILLCRVHFLSIIFDEVSQSVMYVYLVNIHN